MQYPLTCEITLRHAYVDVEVGVNVWEICWGDDADMAYTCDVLELKLGSCGTTHLALFLLMRTGNSLYSKLVKCWRESADVTDVY